MPPLVEFREPRVECRELLTRGDHARLGLAQLLFARLALLELPAISFERERLALALFLLGRELAHQLLDDLAPVAPQRAQVIENQGR